MIVRCERPPDERFTVLRHTAIRDPRLNLRARGLHTYLMTMADGWEVRLGQLVKEFAEGRDAIRRAMSDLQAAGYAERRHKWADGRLQGSEWVIFEKENPQRDGFSGDRVSSAPAKPPVRKKDQVKENQHKESPMDSDTPPGKGSRKATADRTQTELALADMVTLDMLAPPEMIRAFANWKGYRRERATRPLTREKSAPWTERAAEAAARNLNALCAKYGIETAVACVDKAINRRWLEVYGPRENVSQLKGDISTKTQDQLSTW